ncbi:MAG: rod shape-determining protein RodA, partial [Bacteroidaceae bacterium]|nr:rod shape-determining protein RodA [Bacteroidaceae bacterium]
MISIYAASYDFDGANILDWTERSGKQMMWIGLAFVLGFVILMLDYRVYETYAYLIYFVTVVLLIATIFLASDIKGSYSWIKLGFFNLQPAEFAKFATSLALARLMDSYNFKLTKPVNFIRASALILLPVILIILQRETGSALVYGALAFVLYREGMSGTVLFAGLCAIVFFVVGIKYSAVMWDKTPLGEFSVLLLILVIVIVALRFYYRDNRMSNNLLLISVLTTTVFYVLSLFDIRVNYVYPVLGVIILSVIYLLLVYLQVRVRKLLLIMIFPIIFTGYLFSVDYVFSSVLEPHQQVRIRVSLGMEDDPRGAGYNVRQSVIAIGSGGFSGKGFLNGTQTKLKYVPEQDTD